MQWWMRFLRKSRADRQLDSELRFHLEQQIADYIASGLSADEARRRARLDFGGLDQVKERVHAAHRGYFLETLLQDIRYGLRMLRKSPGFTTVAVITLALGIGANTAIFSAVNGILLPSLPYADASRIVRIEGYKHFSDGMAGALDFSPDVWKQVRARTPDIQRMALYEYAGSLTLTAEAVPEVVNAQRVSADFFPLLGARPLLGRPILSADTRPGANPVVVLNHQLWRSSFGGDRNVIGRTITLDGERYTMIGVMPRDFAVPVSEQDGVWLPLVSLPNEKSNEQGATALARLKPGVTIEGINAQLRTVSSHVSADVSDFFSGWYFLASPLKPRFGDLDRALFILLGAVGFVLLIACVNVSGLLLGRGWARQKEVAVREALGATRARILRQFLTESVVIALLGGALGLLLSVWGVHILRAITPADAPEHGHFQVDVHVLWFTLAVSLLAGMLFGIAPAMQASARKIGATLKENLGGSVGGFSGRRTKRLRNTLAAFEIALAVMLVTGATLAARSLENLMSVNLGFSTAHILVMTPDFGRTICDPKKNSAACRLAVDNALDKIRSVPGVESAAITSTIPLGTWQVAPNVRIEGREQEISLGSGNIIENRVISPGYFPTMGIPLLSGREFTDGDTADSEPVAIVSRNFACKYLGDHPLGRRISERDDKNGHPEWVDVVGVVENARDFRDQKRDPYPEIFLPFGQATNALTTFLVRTTVDPTVLVPAVKRAIWAVDKNAPITDVETMDQQVKAVTAEPRFQTTLLGSFAALGLLMAAIGVYGVISYAVAQRTHEIGVRMALGAQRVDVLRSVIGEGAALAVIGIAAGVGGAFALTRFLRSLLFEVKPTDPATFAGVAGVILFVALAACYIPARRAMKVDPMVALRHE
ncbi:MAG TPA: ABC transporter permease [Candidatus Acidoferrum sp.]|nr:ABC transporter permease [Candidatus Acidoferrum sp.]